MDKEPQNVCCRARSPDDFDAWSPGYLIKVKLGVPNEMLWSPEAPIFLSMSPVAAHILHVDRSPGALSPFNPNPNQKKPVLPLWTEFLFYTVQELLHDQDPIPN